MIRIYDTRYNNIRLCSVISVLLRGALTVDIIWFLRSLIFVLLIISVDNRLKPRASRRRMNVTSQETYLETLHVSISVLVFLNAVIGGSTTGRSLSLATGR
jgi:hypothetical protein